MDTTQCSADIINLVDVSLGAYKEMAMKKGRGHWGHRGRKGKRGGSLPSRGVALNLGEDLSGLKGNLASAAQEVYDEWDPSEEGFDIKFGSGGICDSVASSMGGVIISESDDVEIFQGGQEGDDHAYLIVRRSGEAYTVDIPPYIYEVGGGYHWEKVPDVRIEPGDVVIDKIPEEDILYILVEEF